MTIIALTALSIVPAHAAGETTILHFSNMVCGADPHIIRQSLSAIKGVEKVEVSLEAASATVSFDNAIVTAQQLANTVGAAGYPATLTQ